MEAGEWFRRKARIVACGNMIAESGEETYADLCGRCSSGGGEIIAVNL